MGKDENRYKDIGDIWLWLSTALRKEVQKHKAVPVTHDLAPEYKNAQGWGYVVVGYSLIEQGFKAVLHLRNVDPPKVHDLHKLFTKLPREDQNVLRAYYDDFLRTFPGVRSFPLKTLDCFLKNLDGSNKGGDRKGCFGPFDWRYFLTEKGSGKPLPTVSAYIMYEVVFGCESLLLVSNQNDQKNYHKKALERTYSFRLQRKRQSVYNKWLRENTNFSQRGQECDHIEILWGGPDYSDLYDYVVFKRDRRLFSYSRPFHNIEEVKFKIIDKRFELQLFDSKKDLTPTYYVMD